MNKTKKKLYMVIKIYFISNYYFQDMMEACFKSYKYIQIPNCELVYLSPCL